MVAATMMLSCTQSRSESSQRLPSERSEKGSEGAAAAALTGVSQKAASQGSLTPSSTPTAPQPAPAPAAPLDQPTPSEAAPRSATVELRFRTVPAEVEARVRHGRKRLGVIPALGELVIERPRDSGPLDVILSSPGFLSVHTRAHTFDDAVVEVRMTPEDKRETLFGYKKPLPTSDAGLPGGLVEGNP